MFKELLARIGFDYAYISRGRGKLTAEELQQISGAGKTVVEKAQLVLGDGMPLDKEQQTDLQQAAMMEQHVIELVQFLLSQEIMG